MKLEMICRSNTAFTKTVFENKILNEMDIPFCFDEKYNENLVKETFNSMLSLREEFGNVTYIDDMVDKIDGAMICTKNEFGYHKIISDKFSIMCLDSDKKVNGRLYITLVGCIWEVESIGPIVGGFSLITTFILVMLLLDFKNMKFIALWYFSKIGAIAGSIYIWNKFGLIYFIICWIIIAIVTFPAINDKLFNLETWKNLLKRCRFF